jgi:hypothetical protein
MVALFHARKTPARPRPMQWRRAAGCAAAEFLPQGLRGPVRAAAFPQHRGCRPERRQRLCCSNSERPEGPAAEGWSGRRIQISICIALLADAKSLAPCRPAGAPMPMAPSAMMHEQCCTCPQVAGQLSARRWRQRCASGRPAVPDCQALQPIASASFSDVAYCDLGDDTAELGNTSGSVAIECGLPTSQETAQHLCCAEGCPTLVGHRRG